MVGNPPYITVKDARVREAVRREYRSAAGRYSLAAPFAERFFDLAREPERNRRSGAGYVGMITANSFMKREFGRTLCEQVVPELDLTGVLDTSGAYVPGHGTPTVILLGRNRAPVDRTVRAALGIRGEPETPVDPAQGQVWRAIVDHLDEPGYEDEYVSVVDLDRARLHGHPWSLTGGGALDLMDLLEKAGERKLGDVVDAIGFGAVTREDEVFLLPRPVLERTGIPLAFVRPSVRGEDLRDWSIAEAESALFPYSHPDLNADPGPGECVARRLWRWRRGLSDRVAYGRTQVERGLAWYEFSMLFKKRYRRPLSLAFAFVATHNQFVLDRGGKVFNRTAPVIKLPEGATEEEHLALLGLLNSSVACFWMKQVFHDKGSGTDKGKWQDDPAKIAYEFVATGLGAFPLPALDSARRSALVALTRRADSLAQERSGLIHRALPAALPPDVDSASAVRARLDEAERRNALLLGSLIAAQEEMDWLALTAYGLVQDTANQNAASLDHGVRLGERPFEILAARKGATVGTDSHKLAMAPPDSWPASTRAVWEQRISLVGSVPAVALVEAPEHKRRWTLTPKATGGRVLRFRERLGERVRAWLLDRLESPCYFPHADREHPPDAPPALVSCAQLAARAADDDEFLAVAEVYHRGPAFDLAALVTELVLAEAVPFLAALRLKPSGLRKRAVWEEVWTLQRREDAGEDVGTIPKPPRYASSDFRATTYWRLRGKLDVPRERFVLYPGAERATDPSPVVAWAGLDHLQRATALAAWYVERRRTDGWPTERLVPLLAGLDQLVPWLLQWHNDLHPAYGQRMGDYYRDFVAGECTSLCVTLDDLRAWRPPARRGGRRRT